jgi:hypothetical protein
MEADLVWEKLNEITRIEGELAAARRAPPSHAEQLAAAKARLKAAGEQFKARPFRVGSASPAAFATALLGMAQEIAPASALELIERQIKSLPEGLDRKTRQARIAACEAKIAELVRSLSHDDLRQTRRKKDEAHAFMRSLTARRDEVRALIAARAAAIAEYAKGREELRRPPRRDAYFGNPQQLGRAERAVAGEAADGWLTEAQAELAADQRTMAEIERSYGTAAFDWRMFCQWVEQLEKLLPVLPAPANVGS